MPNNHSFAHADATRRHGMHSDAAAAMGKPMQASDRERLITWFAGQVALTRTEAHRLLESAVESGLVAQYRAEFVAAIKALAVDSKSWHATGYRLLPDH